MKCFICVANNGDTDEKGNERNMKGWIQEETQYQGVPLCSVHAVQVSELLADGYKYPFQKMFGHNREHHPERTRTVQMGSKWEKLMNWL